MNILKIICVCFRDAVSSSIGFTADELVYIGPYLYTIEDDGSVTVHLGDTLGSMSLSMGVTSSIFMILYFGMKCYRKLNNMMSHVESQKIRKLQHQLFVALVIQTLVPIFLIHIPSTIVFMAAFMNISLGSLTGVMCVTVALFPAIDPLPTMFIIEEYRKTIFGGFPCLIFSVGALQTRSLRTMEAAATLATRECMNLRERSALFSQNLTPNVCAIGAHLQPFLSEHKCKNHRDRLTFLKSPRKCFRREISSKTSIATSSITLKQVITVTV
uniref:G protein-coupled receptor n=1 Tax=Caenorhabditis japonica TaxID=281687 RepID=A0A8R1E978_CAEJA